MTSKQEKLPETFRDYESLEAFADHNCLEVTTPEDDPHIVILKRPGATRRSAAYAERGFGTHDTHYVRI